jgi:hypothetical protein
VLTLEFFKHLSLSEITGQVVSVCLSIRPTVLTSSVHDRHLHTGSQILELVDTGFNLIWGTNYVDGLTVISARRKDYGAASLFQEVVQGTSTVPNDELVAPSLDRTLFDS